MIHKFMFFFCWLFLHTPCSYKLVKFRLKALFAILLLLFYGGAHGVMVIVAGNGHGVTSSKTGRD